MFKPTWKKGRQCVYMMRMDLRRNYGIAPVYRKGMAYSRYKGRTERNNPVKFKWVDVYNPPKRKGIW